MQLQLRRVFQTVGAHANQVVRLLRGLAEQDVAGLGQLFVAGTATVLQPHVKATELAQALHGGQVDHEDLRFLDAVERAVHVLDELGRGELAFLPRLQADEAHAHVLAGTDEAEAGHLQHAFIAILLFQDATHLREHFVGLALGRARRQLHDRQRIALVFFRQEAARHAGEQEAAQRGQHHEQDHPARRMAHRRGDVAHIGVADLVVVLVEGAVDDVRVVVVRRLEEGRAQRRREAQGQERRECHRDGDGQRELLVDLTGGTALQGGGDEHRGQHDGDRHHRTGDLGHRFLRGRLGRQALLGHDAFDVLDHHDRVVDHDADRQHHRKQRQLVDGEADHPHAQEGTEQGDRDHQGRDQGGAEVLQEDQHHQEHQQDRFKQGLDHFLDRDLDERGAVVRREPGHPGREAGLQLVHLGAHRFGHVQGIGARQKLDGEGAGRLAVVLGVEAVVVGTEGDAGDVLQQHARTVSVGAQDDVLEFLR